MVVQWAAAACSRPKPIEQYMSESHIVSGVLLLQRLFLHTLQIVQTPNELIRRLRLKGLGGMTCFSRRTADEEFLLSGTNGLWLGLPVLLSANFR